MSRIGTDRRPVTTPWFIRRWVTARLGGISHERRVWRIASALAQVTGELHDLSPAQRRLLKLAALVHDVGRSVEDASHPQIGADMLMEDRSIPLKRRQRRALAYLTLYHRGRVPKPQEDSILSDKDERRELRLVLAFLRAADCLDCRSLPSPVISMALRGRNLRIRCRVRGDYRKGRRAFTRPKKFRLLERLLGCRLEVTVEPLRLPVAA